MHDSDAVWRPGVRERIEEIQFLELRNNIITGNGCNYDNYLATVLWETNNRLAYSCVT